MWFTLLVLHVGGKKEKLVLRVGDLVLPVGESEETLVVVVIVVCVLI